MTLIGWLQILVFALALFAVTKPLGIFMHQVLNGDEQFLSKLLGPMERLTYKLFGVDPSEEMSWVKYGQALLWFSLASTLFTYGILRFQGLLPLNPMHFSTDQSPSWSTSLTPDLVFNTAMSFATNTNWQAYSGENTMSYLSQMLGLAYHNWISAAAGFAVAAALIRGFSRQNSSSLGNFWADITRCSLYILFPIGIVYSLFLVWQGVPQSLDAYKVATTLEGGQQIIPLGPIASQEWIKMLGINGGGFLNANSSHPFENPTPITNFVQMLSIFLLPAGLTYAFGKSVGDVRQGWALLAVMFILWLAGTFLCYHFEASGNPNISKLGVETSTAVLGDLGGNQEGKEIRFGLANSALFSVVTTDASCGAVNCMHDSFTPIAGMILLINMQLGEIIFGGVGSGLYGMLIYAILTVFIAGLMVGRTPEYVGKKIEKKEVKLAMLFLLAAAFSILVLTAISTMAEFPVKDFFNPQGAAWNNVNNAGPHGLSEILYAFSSATGNNGSAFAGISVNTPFYNTLLAIAMFIGRFFMMVPVIVMAGSLANKKLVPATSGTFPTHSWLFVVLLVSIILIVGALTFFPALTLGPIVEQFLMNDGSLF